MRPDQHFLNAQPSRISSRLESACPLLRRAGVRLRRLELMVLLCALANREVRTLAPLLGCPRAWSSSLMHPGSPHPIPLADLVPMAVLVGVSLRVTEAAPQRGLPIKSAPLAASTPSPSRPHQSISLYSISIMRIALIAHCTFRRR